MCDQCNYGAMLEAAGLEATEHRLLVLEVIGGNNCPLSAADIFQIIERTSQINRVTVYRILELLVEGGLVERIRLGGRAAHYGLAAGEHHPAHPHFRCTRCAAIDCLPPESLSIDTTAMERTFPGTIERVEVQVEGICRNCLRQR